MNLFDIVDEVQRLLPVIGGMTGHPEVGSLLARLIELGEEEARRRMQATGGTRAEVLADATATFARFKIENAALKKAGHETDPPAQG
jgi:hypothetical protein